MSLAVRMLTRTMLPRRAAAAATSTSQVRAFAQAPQEDSTALGPAPIRLHGLSARYAHALFSTASRNKALDAVEKDLQTAAGWLETNDHFKTLVTDPFLKKGSKEAALRELSKKAKFNKSTEEFFAVLAQNGRLKETSGIIDTFGELMSAQRGEVNATVTSVEPLDKKVLAELQQSLKKFIKPTETLKLKTKIDKDIVGGLIIDIGDKTIDDSFRTRLNKMSAMLLEKIDA